MKVLILSDLGMASPRVLNIAKGLSELGHQTYLLTPSMNREQKKLFGIELYGDLEVLNFKYFKMQYFRYRSKLARKLSQLINSVMIAIFRDKDLKLLKINEYHFSKAKTAIKQTINVIDMYKIDSLITSSGPIAMQYIGRSVKARRDIIWIADYQDLWSLNHNSKKYSDKTHQRYERDLLRSANGVITVSNGLSKKITKIYKGPIETIYLGLFTHQNLPKNNNFSTFTVLYTGQVYSKFQKLDDFLSVIVNNQVPLKGIDFLFIGQCSELVKDYFKKLNLEIPKCIILKKQVNREDSIKYQSMADILLIFKWEDRNEPGVLPTKFYEYLSVRKPILAYGTAQRNELSDFIQEYKMGHEVSSKVDLVKFLVRFSKSKRNKAFCYDALHKTLSYESQSKKLSKFIQNLSN
jgi:hypothetical protein